MTDMVNPLSTADRPPQREPIAGNIRADLVECWPKDAVRRAERSAVTRIDASTAARSGRSPLSGAACIRLERSTPQACTLT
jgi:hypothetical protein